MIYLISILVSAYVFQQFINNTIINSIGMSYVYYQYVGIVTCTTN